MVICEVLVDVWLRYRLIFRPRNRTRLWGETATKSSGVGAVNQYCKSLLSKTGLVFAGLVSGAHFAEAGNPDFGSKNMGCSLEGNGTTIESCRNAVDFWQSGMAVLKSARRRDPKYFSLEVYNKRKVEIEKKLQDVLDVLGKLRSRPPETRIHHRSSFIWPQGGSRQTNPPAINSKTWDGVMAIGVPSFSVSFDYIFEVSGTITVPNVALPNNATCGSSTATYEAGEWVGIGGEDPPGQNPPTIPGDPDQGQLVQVGVAQKIVCALGYPSGQITNQVFVENYVDQTSLPINLPYAVNAGDVIAIIVDTSANHPGNPPVMYYTITDTPANGVGGWSVPKTSLHLGGILPHWTAEAIVERPCMIANGAGTCLPMPQPISPVNFPFSGLKYCVVITTGSQSGVPTQEAFNFQPMNVALNVPGTDCFANDDASGPCVTPAPVNIGPNSCDVLTATDNGNAGALVAYAFNGIPDPNTQQCSLP